MADLPHCEEIKLSEQNGVLGLRLARPEVRNALSERMIAEMITALEFAVSSGLRALVLRGEGGNFCSGGDVRDMARALSAGRPAGADPVAALNRRYGELLERLESGAARGRVRAGGRGCWAAEWGWPACRTWRLSRRMRSSVCPRLDWV